MSGLRSVVFLVMDSTNLKLGGIDINVLIIGACCSQTAASCLSSGRPWPRRATTARKSARGWSGRGYPCKNCLSRPLTGQLLI
jgi:hypothetical protein